jgi:hypothetical protein
MERPNPVPHPVIKIVRPLSKSFWNMAASETLRILDASLLVSQGHSTSYHQYAARNPLVEGIAGQTGLDEGHHKCVSSPKMPLNES